MRPSKHYKLAALTLVVFVATVSRSALADYAAGTRVPAPTAANQSVYSGSTAPFTYHLVTLPYVTNGTQMAVGGTVDSGSRLSVNPSGMAENGLTVNMPSGFTGSAITVKNSTGGNLFYFDQYGYVHGGNFYGGFNGNVGGGTGSFYTVTSNVTAVTIRNYVASPSANLTEWYLGSSNIPTATITTNCNANFPGYCQAVRTVNANDTATLADSLLLINGAYAETLPAASIPTGRTFTAKEIGASSGSLTNTVDGAAGYTLTPGSSVSVIWDGSAFRTSDSLVGGAVSGTSDSITATSGIVTAVRTPAAGTARLADFSLSATGNGGSGSQTLAAGAAWTPFALDTQTSATTSTSLASRYTVSTSRFLAEAVGKAYLFRVSYNTSITAGGSGYLEFAFDTSSAGDGSGIKSTTPVYIAGNALAAMSYLFDTSMPLFARTSGAVTAPGPELEVRFVGTGTDTISNGTLTIADLSGVSNN